MKIKTQHKPFSLKNKNHKAKNIRIGFISPVQDAEKSSIFCESLKGFCELDFNLSILAEGNTQMQKCCLRLSQKYPHLVSLLESIPQNKEKIIKNTDCIIFGEKPSKELLAEIVSQNIVTILPENSGLNDFDLKNETGEAFTYLDRNPWSMIAAAVRANENHKFPYDWQTIKRNITMMVF